MKPGISQRLFLICICTYIIDLMMNQNIHLFADDRTVSVIDRYIDVISRELDIILVYIS